MMISRNAIFTLALVAGLMLIGGDVLAQGADKAGSTFLDAVQKASTGNLGLAIGLCLAILGIWTWVVKQETGAGIFLIIGGILITITPGVFNSLRSIVNPLVSTVAGGSLTDVKSGGGVNQGYQP